MNRDRVEGGWKQIIGKFREQWGSLTDNRATVLAGMHNQLAGRVQAEYGIASDAAERQLVEFRLRNRDWKSV